MEKKVLASELALVMGVLCNAIASQMKALNSYLHLQLY